MLTFDRERSARSINNRIIILEKKQQGSLPRTCEFEPQVALNKAMLLFWQRGYADTSMEDLVAQTGVSRYGLYGTFGNKHDLFVATLDHYRDVIVARLLDPLEQPSVCVAAIIRYFESLMTLIGPSGT